LTHQQNAAKNLSHWMWTLVFASDSSWTSWFDSRCKQSFRASRICGPATLDVAQTLYKMEKGLDELIEWLLTEIAFSGLEGESNAPSSACLLRTH
jgi:hypothetical protein